MLLVYRTSDAMLPTAVYVDAKTTPWNHDSIVLDPGLTLTDEGWHDADGQPQTVARPISCSCAGTALRRLSPTARCGEE